MTPELVAMVERWRKAAKLTNNTCLTHPHLPCAGCELIKCADELEAILSRETGSGLCLKATERRDEQLIGEMDGVWGYIAQKGGQP